MSDKKTTTLKIDDQTAYDILELIEWGLSDYPDPNDDRYNRIIALANRLEKARCRMNGLEWGSWRKWEQDEL